MKPFTTRRTNSAHATFQDASGLMQKNRLRADPHVLTFLSLLLNSLNPFCIPLNFGHKEKMFFKTSFQGMMQSTVLSEGEPIRTTITDDDFFYGKP